MNAEELKNKLTYENRDGFREKGDGWVAEARKYAEGYCRFISLAKTEREAVAEGIKMLGGAGYREFKFGDALEPGGKYYLNNRGKALYAFRMGDLTDGIAIAASHADSPRLDLKQHPIFEKEGLCYLRTHYYGSPRRYQWVALPLALHGTVCRADGESVEINIGEEPGDPVFYISDLLPHLAAKQNAKTLGEAFSGEAMTALCATSPIVTDGEKISDAVKLNFLALLNEKYGITESDFMSAELCLVPAGGARDVGLDRMLIAAYGHDDTVCAYPSLTAFIETDGSPRAAICVLADKEEIGSEGTTGMQSAALTDIIDAMAAAGGITSAALRSRSLCISADVTAAYDPSFRDVFDCDNVSFLHRGIAMSKYTGARGKATANDASAETVARIRRIFDGDGVLWQTSELGAVDAGGGGTVAKYAARLNIETVDIGVPVMSMHGTFEAISKIDLYSTHEALVAFYKA